MLYVLSGLQCSTHFQLISCTNPTYQAISNQRIHTEPTTITDGERPTSHHVRPYIHWCSPYVGRLSLERCEIRHRILLLSCTATIRIYRRREDLSPVTQNCEEWQKIGIWLVLGIRCAIKLKLFVTAVIIIPTVWESFISWFYESWWRHKLTTEIQGEAYVSNKAL